MQIAVVATARKLTVLCWTVIERGEDYEFARPSPTDKKLRALELRAGMPSRRGLKAKAVAWTPGSRPIEAPLPSRQTPTLAHPAIVHPGPRICRWRLIMRMQTIVRATGDIGTLGIISLRSATVHTTLPVSDLERATTFFRDKLGLIPASETESTAFYQAREGQLVLFLSAGKPSGDHTQIGWTVDDIEATVGELRTRGVVFDDYDYPDFKTTGSIATFGDNRFAWFRDSEGNVHSLTQFGKSPLDEVPQLTADVDVDGLEPPRLGSADADRPSAVPADAS
jgi:catechol 2,3-dioxygenase-like lactoylglutathione lyase family enzyme